MSRMVSHRDHPIWATIRFVVLVSAVTILLWLNADSFDATERNTILELAMGYGGWQAFQTFHNREK